MSNLRSVLPQIAPFPLTGLVGAFTSRVMRLNEMETTYEYLRAMDAGQSLPARLLERLQVRYRVAGSDLAQIPAKGAAILVMNHPFGILEAAVLATVLEAIRPDVRFLANGILMAIPEIRHLVIPVDPTGGEDAVRANRGGLRRALEFLRSGGLLVVFPAGEVSHFDWRRRVVTDPRWSTSVTRLVEISSRQGVAVSVVPAYVHGTNSLLFQTLGTLHPRLRTAMLPRELLNKKKTVVDLRIGSPVSSGKLLEIATHEERTGYLRWRTYLLANRGGFKPRTALPLLRRGRKPGTQEEIAPAVDAGILTAEIAALPPDCRLGKSGDLEVYLSRAALVPNVLREIARLREVTFRAVGEGTGRRIDLDRFDATYLHLFVWNATKLEVVGAYRLAATEEAGGEALYTATLFDYGEAFLNKLGPALELGRSFVRPEYQKGFAPLLLLWKGIGEYVARNPQYRILFGPVSISNQYQAVSRELMVRFLEKYAALRDWRGLVAERNPFRPRGAPAVFPGPGFDIEDLSEVVSDLEPNRAGVPVLLRQYLRLGGKLLGFNVDPQFAHVLDGLILVDLTQTEPKLLERYLGKTQAAQFLAFQKGRHATQ